MHWDIILLLLMLKLLMLSILLTTFAHMISATTDLDTVHVDMYHDHGLSTRYQVLTVATAVCNLFCTCTCMYTFPSLHGVHTAGYTCIHVHVHVLVSWECTKHMY